MHILFTFLFLFAASSLQAQDCDHSRGRTQNTLIPDAKFTLLPRNVTDNSAVAFLGEAGRRNFRFNGTFGLMLDCEKRVKFSGEYLQQKLGYNYSNGTARRWVRQFAFGGVYEQDFCNDYITSGEISAYCSYAPSRHLSRQVCSNNFLSRRIAGSTAYGIELGSTIKLFPCSFLFIDANYDAVIYHRRYHSNKHVEGFGGSIGFHQQFFDNVGVDLRAEFRRPFNYYRAALNWTVPQCKGLTVGIFGSHSRGKSSLPSNTMAGIELNCIFGDFFRNGCCEDDCAPCYCAPELACWVSRPAVYLPEVLAIAEEKLRPRCALPISTTIPNVTLLVAGPFSINTANFFASPDGTPLIFSAAGLPPGATIDPVTGVISGVATSGMPPFVITVTATNACGSSSQSFTLSFCTNVPTSTTIPPFAACALGPFSYAVGGFFTNPPGSNPLVFSATGLPVFATIDPATGTISGVNPGDSNVYNVTVTADNGCSSTSQVFTMTFTCPAPTSVSIPDQNLALLPGDPYTLDVVTGRFTSPCGQPFTFTATGLPSGSSMNPVTGLISGTVPASGGPFSVTVTGTTVCGSTSRTFNLSFESS